MKVADYIERKAAEPTEHFKMPPNHIPLTFWQCVRYYFWLLFVKKSMTVNTRVGPVNVGWVPLTKRAASKFREAFM